MARALCNAGIIAALSDGIALLGARRGYSTAAAVAGRRAATAEEAVRTGKRDVSGESPAASSWVPDPVTGYYRPANRAAEIDPAALREMLLNQKSSR